MNQSVEKRKRSSRRFFLTGLGCLAVVALVLAGGLYMLQGFREVMESVQINYGGEEAREMVGVVWGGSLPTDASDLHYFSYGGIDGKGYARFSLPASVWNETFSSNPSCAEISKAEWDAIQNNLISADWWTPHVGNPTSLIIDNHCSGKEYHKRDIRLDTSNPDTYTVYIVEG